MSESDSSIRQKLRALAYALGAVSIQVVRMRRFSRSFHSWFEVKGPDVIPGVRYPRDVLDAAAEFVEKVATADQMLDAIPVSALEPLSGLTGGVRWDVRTRRTLRAIQHETAILECHSRDPEGLLLGLCWMGEDGLMQMQSKLDESLLELTQRILDLNSLPDDQSGQTKPISVQQRANQEPMANQNGNTPSDGDSVLPSSKPKNLTETDDNFDTALAREQLRPYVENPAFRQYVKEQITQWELWHRSHTEQINEHEGLRDNLHQELKELQGRDLRHSEDPADFDTLGITENCYKGHRDAAAWLKDDPDYKLVAVREPVLFKEASVASIVALFWCDVNDSTLLVPKYDSLEPKGPFIEYLREQWKKPIQGRYKHIDWFVEKAIELYESTSDGGSVVPSTTTLPLIGDNVHVGMAELPGLTKLCTSLDQQHKPQGTLYRDQERRFIYHILDNDDESVGKTCQLVRPAVAHEIARKAHEFHVDKVELYMEFEELQKQTAKEREAAFDEAISNYRDSDWKRDKKLNNKVYRVRSGKQMGELFGDDASERGWLKLRTKKLVVKKDDEGFWGYLTASHSKELEEFFSAFVT
jgi:hypothetical protein